MTGLDELTAGLHVRKVIAEHHPDGAWLTLDVETGGIAEYDSPEAVLRAVRAAGEKAAAARTASIRPTAPPATSSAACPT